MTVINDPIPDTLTGDAATVGAKARKLGRTAEALRAAIAELKQLASSDVTISDAVDELRDKADDVSSQMGKVETRYQGAADAMSDYHSRLSDAQSRANHARQRIMDNNTDASYWRHRLKDLTERAASGETSQELLDDVTEARRKVDVYNGEFHSAMSQYNAAVDDKSSAVDAAVSALHDAADAAGLNDGWRDKVGDFLENAYEWAQEHLGPVLEAIRSVLEVIKSIVDILALIVTILAIFLPFLAPLAAALSLASIALAGLIFLSSLLLFALGRESLGRVIGDAIGIVTSVVTSKMGGMNVFSPGAKLTGLSSVFTRSAWSSGTSMVKLEFALSSAIMGKSETIAGMGLDVAKKLFEPRAFVKMGGGLMSEFAKGGIDVQMDFFPEGGNGGGFGPFSGGFDLNVDEAAYAVGKPVAQILSGGASNPIISLTGGIKTLVGAS